MLVGTVTDIELCETAENRTELAGGQVESEQGGCLDIAEEGKELCHGHNS